MASLLLLLGLGALEWLWRGVNMGREHLGKRVRGAELECDRAF